MLGGTEARSQTASHGLTEGVGFRGWVVMMVSLLLSEEKEAGWERLTELWVTQDGFEV